jgi:hypothetical protein
MSDPQKLDLTNEECDILVKGLRYVRSSIMLDPQDSTPEDQQVRSLQINKIQNLMSRLGKTSKPNVTADV